MKPLHSLFVIILLSVACHIVSCSNPELQETFNRAESLMESDPASALKLLSAIDKTSLSGKAEKARYALLMSMALDKNYIDTTNFDVLQPAIEYYPDHGTPNEKLKTYYYQGIIFLNKGDRDSALNSFIKSIDISQNSDDSLTIARLFVAQGGLYYDLYDFEDYINCNLKAAEIYNKLSLRPLEFDCFIKVLYGVIWTNDHSRSDSILNLLGNFTDLDDSQRQILSRHRLMLALRFSETENIHALIHEQETRVKTIDDLLDLALAYSKTGKCDRALQLLDQVRTCGLPYDTLRYLSLLIPPLEATGRDKEALSTYKKFNSKHDSITLHRFEQKTLAMEEKHKIALQAQKDARHKSKIIWSCIGGIVVLAMGIVILLLLVRSNRTKKALALEKVRAKESENAKLKSESEKLTLEKDRLALENKNLQLEMDNKALEAENLAHRVATLETESDSLRALIDAKEELPGEVKDAIKVRIEMLNSLLASYITANDQYEKPYDTWVRELTDNTEAFMNSNRLAFQASHPSFIQYFENHGLTTEEINYVCLYAIGLRGKEVGNYMKKRSHVNTSSAIRKKLGIDKHETNIGIFVRKLLRDL